MTGAPINAPSPRRILVVTSDTLGARMAGPAIRAFEISKALTRVGSVRLVSTSRSTLETDAVAVFEAGDAELREHVEWSDVVVFQGHILSSHPWLEESSKIIVADLYDPIHLEQLEQDHESGDLIRFDKSIDAVRVLNDQIARADFMVCASEKQRDFWLGQLASVGRVNPDTYDDDPSLRGLLAVAPFGVSDNPPTQRTRGIKGVVPGIGEHDKVIIWGGGIYNWFDPLTLIRAMAELSERRPEVRLFFLGAVHPNPAVPAMRMAAATRELSEELGLTDRIVFFNEQWVPYESRADYLLDADAGVSTHFDHVETSFSFRTRILDYLWASLPIVSTAGDTFAELIERHNLGRVVPPRDVAALAAAMEEVLFDETERDTIRGRVTAFAADLTWSTVLEPLVAFCSHPRRAADRIRGRVIASHVRIDILERRVLGLENSTSWRFTAPIRAVTGLRSQIARRRRRA